MSEAPQREWRFYIDDMIVRAERTMAYTDGINQERFVASGLNYDATIRNLELIDEAATHIPDTVREAHPEIPCRRMVTADFPSKEAGYILNSDRLEAQFQPLGVACHDPVECGDGGSPRFQRGGEMQCIRGAQTVTVLPGEFCGPPERGPAHRDQPRAAGRQQVEFLVYLLGMGFGQFAAPQFNGDGTGEFRN